MAMACRYLHTLLPLATLWLVSMATADDSERRPAPLGDGVALVSGVVHLTFYPLPLAVTYGGQTTGYVNVSLDPDHYHAAGFEPTTNLHICCADSDVIMVTLGDGGDGERWEKVGRGGGDRVRREEEEDDEDEEPRAGDMSLPLDGLYWTIFNVSVRGVRLGRTAIKFYISVNDTGRHGDDSENASADVISANIPGTGDARQSPHRQRRYSTPDTHRADVATDAGQGDGGTAAKMWWLPSQYDVIVKRSPHWLDVYLDYAVMALVAVNMAGVGGQLNPDEILYHVKRPAAVSVALFCRFGVMPALGLGLVELLKPDHGVCLGVLSLLCSPSEGASSLLILLADQDLSLSITIATITNFATIAMLPLWTVAFERRIYQVPGRVQIPFRQVFLVFTCIVAANCLGFFLSKKCPKLYGKVWSFLPPFTILTLLFAVSVHVYQNDFVFELVTAEIFFLSAMLAAAGYLFGAAVAFISRQALSRIIVIAVETGGRTVFISCLVLHASLSEPENDVAKTTPVLSELLSILPALVVVLLYRTARRYRASHYAATECTLTDSKENLTESCCNDEPEVTEAKETTM